jgi:GH24 family phage-related lysozyme (muramidase)
MIKLKDLLRESNIIKMAQDEVQEDYQPPADKAPYSAHELTPPVHVAYADPAGYKNVKGMEPYVPKNTDFTGMSTAKKFEVSANFIKYLKRVENNIKKGFKNGKWYPHPAVEGGKSWDIGYGHKITAKDDMAKFRNGLTEQEVMALLKNDIEKAKTEVENYLKNNRLPTNLSQHQWEMLIDYSYNLGTVRKFPEMVKAVVFKDLSKAKREYKRFGTFGGTKKELGRNAEFYNTYLKDPNVWKNGLG